MRSAIVNVFGFKRWSRRCVRDGHREMPFEAMIRLRDDLDEMLQRIRRERQIRSPVTQCPECGHIGESAPPHVSVRAMILRVSRFAIDDLKATRAIEKAWKA